MNRGESEVTRLSPASSNPKPLPSKNPLTFSSLVWEGGWFNIDISDGLICGQETNRDKVEFRLWSLESDSTMSMLLGKLSEMDLDLGEVRLREVKAEQNLFKGGEDRSGVGSTEGIRRGREVYGADFARRLSIWELSPDVWNKGWFWQDKCDLLRMTGCLDGGG